MKDRFSRIGFNSSHVHDNGVFVKFYADIKLYNYLMGDTSVLVFKCINGYIAFGIDAGRLKTLGYPEKIYGTGINYVTFPEVDLRNVFLRLQKSLKIVKGIPGEGTFANINKTLSNNLLLLSAFL